MTVMHPDDCCPSCIAELESLKVNVKELQRRARATEKDVETLWTPPWKKAWFAINGWPLYRVVERPKSRFWHRWVKP